jgi:uncharacterized OsmC-like protein
VTRRANEAIVRSFQAAWGRRDLERLLEFVSDDCVYHASVGPEPGETFVGRDAVRQGFQRMLQDEVNSGLESNEGQVRCVGDVVYSEWSTTDRACNVVRGIDVFRIEGSLICLKDAFRKTREASGGPSSDLSTSIRLSGGGQCRVSHGRSGASLRTATPPEYGGLGNSFSATDLLVVALGTCIATDLEPVAERHGIPLPSIELTVSKELSTSPKRLVTLRVHVALPASVPDDVVRRISRASNTCVVRRSLHPAVAVEVTFARR